MVLIVMATSDLGKILNFGAGMFHQRAGHKLWNPGSYFKLSQRSDVRAFLRLSSVGKALDQTLRVLQCSPHDLHDVH